MKQILFKHKSMDRRDMNTLAAFVLGLLGGWTVEWIIDRIYWRQRMSGLRVKEARYQEFAKAAEARNADLDHQLSVQKDHLKGLQSKLSEIEAGTGAAQMKVSTSEPERLAEKSKIEPEVTKKAGTRTRRTTPKPIEPDDLQIIKGIGPVIAGKLNQAGIYSFKDLGNLTPDRLRELVGDVISRLADEDSLIQQAKRLAEEKTRKVKG